MFKELWKPIDEYEGLYEVSNIGRVKSIDRYILCSSGIRLYKSKILKYKNQNGYLYVTLSRKNKLHMFIIHRLVAQAFIPNTYNKKEVNHISGDKTDNSVDNLEWCTPSENVKHAWKNGLIIRNRDIKGRFI